MHKYKIGDHVKVNPKFKISEFPKQSAKNWGGEIIESFLGDQGERMYAIQLDAVALRTFSPDYLTFMEEKDYDVEIFDFEEQFLEEIKPRSTEAQRQKAYKKLLEDMYLGTDFQESMLQLRPDKKSKDMPEISFDAPEIEVEKPKRKPKKSKKPWGGIPRNQTIQVKYKDDRLVSGKFKRLEEDLVNGLCTLVDRGDPKA